MFVVASSVRSLPLSGLPMSNSETAEKPAIKIRIGLVGVGNWALHGHLRVLALLPEYEVVAVYARRREAAEAAAELAAAEPAAAELAAAVDGIGEPVGALSGSGLACVDT